MAAVRRFKGKTKFVHLPVTTSTAFAKDSLVEMTSGLVGVADDNDTALSGVIRHTIASTDDNYATARTVEVEVPVERHVIWEFTGQSGFTSSDIGGEYGIQSAVLLDQADTTNKVFLVTEVLNSGATVRGYLKINGSY
jgi:hypothetical protein